MKYKAIGESHLYSKAYSKGKKCVAKRVVVYVLKDFRSEAFRKADPLKRPLNRIGLTVTKKIGSAVERNRVRRILREGYLAVDSKYQLAKGYLVVIVARGQIAGARSGDIERDLLYAFRSLDMIAGGPSVSQSKVKDGGGPVK